MKAPTPAGLAERFRSQRTRRLHELEARLTPLLGPWADPTPGGRLRLLARLPLLPRKYLRYAMPSPWPRPSAKAPAKLRTVPGTWRNPDAEQAAFDERPFHHFVDIHPEAGQYSRRYGWPYIIPSAPRLIRTRLRVAEVQRARPGAADPRLSGGEVTERIRREAQRLRISAVGFAPHDPKYTFAPYAAQQHPAVIIVIVEQDHAATQTAPSRHAERAAFVAYTDLEAACAELADYVQRLGFHARPQGFIGEGVAIHYAVQAGLGQLGLNGQLLTPQAGSRARIGLITTDANVVWGEPADFGIHALCDACQVCVRRCPPGAIPNTRREFRGVVKAKIKPERCYPVLSQTHGCAGPAVGPRRRQGAFPRHRPDPRQGNRRPRRVPLAARRQALRTRRQAAYYARTPEPPRMALRQGPQGAP